MRKAELDITEEGTLEDFLGVNIDRKPNGSIYLTKLHLINNILEYFNLLGEGVKIKTTPASQSQILKRHQTSKDFENAFHYGSVIRKLNYLERGSQSDMSYIIQQFDRFSTFQKYEHGEAIKWLGRYLLYTKDKGTILTPNMKQDMDFYFNADFASNYDSQDTHSRDTAGSRHEYIGM